MAMSFANATWKKAVHYCLIGVGAAIALVIAIGIGVGFYEAATGISPSEIARSGSAPTEAQDTVYLCQSPASTLRLVGDNTGAMMIRGSLFEGHWSKSAEGVIEFTPNIGAPSHFAVLSDNSLRETKYGYQFQRISR